MSVVRFVRGNDIELGQTRYQNDFARLLESELALSIALRLAFKCLVDNNVDSARVDSTVRN